MAATKTDLPIVLVTGANRGIGYYISQQIAGTGKYHVLVGSRKVEAAQEAIDKLVADTSVANVATSFTPVQIDVSSDDSIVACAKHVADTFGRLEVLINNAGVAGAQTAPVTKEEVEQQGAEDTLRNTYRYHYETNLFGSAVAIEAFTPLLRASKYHDRRIVNVSSGVGSITYAADDNSMFPVSKWAFTIYRTTKAALNMLTVAQGATLGKEGISVVSADPGYCATDFTHHTGYRDPRDGAACIVKGAIEGKGEDVNKKFLSTEAPSGEFAW